MRTRPSLAGLAAASLSPLPAFAAGPGAAAGASVGFSQLAQVLGALLLVLALIAGLALASRRLRLGRGVGGRHLRIVDALALGARERLLLVDVAGERVLLGVAAGRIERLHVLAPGAAAADVDAAGAPAPAFTSVLDAVFGGRKEAS